MSGNWEGDRITGNMENVLGRLHQVISDLPLKLTRRKVIRTNPLQTDLQRVLTTWGIILFGIGQISGGGPFVVAGSVARTAGPGVVLSFAISGVVAIMAALCFAEFASIIPRTGSGYLFAYVTMGEFMAFFVGWQLMLDQILSVSSVCSSISGAINAASSDAIRNFTITYIGTFKAPVLAPYPDFVGVLLTIVAAFIMSFGLSRSAMVSNSLNVINMIIILFCIGYGFALGSIGNWRYKGFFPFGFRGVMEAACNCFTSYIGFEGIASAGEETFNPRKTIPRAILGALSILIVLYVLMAAAITLEVPFDQLSTQAAFPSAFRYLGLEGASVFVGIGIALGMFGSLIGSVYAVGRTGYAMASDGLLFPVFARLSSGVNAPVWGEMIFCFLAAVFTLIFDLRILVEFQNAGTLVAYTIVAGCSVILHYQARVRVYSDVEPELEPFRIADPDEVSSSPRNWPFCQRCTWFFPEFAVDIALVCFCIFMGLFLTASVYMAQNKTSFSPWTFIPGICLLIGALLSFIVIFAHPTRKLRIPFRMPFPTMIPIVSILLNLSLLVFVAELTWIRFGAWIILGLVIYLFYGMEHSNIRIDAETVGTDAPGGRLGNSDEFKDFSPGAFRRTLSNFNETESDEKLPLLG
ncbi:high affinity cationic amino acid transporter 1-like [Paramacrobiotus metropolitanus]|uniref:high affinity cationic amino acid transporter 1-like n=1 Tax=Paramacrobiotus metropolitanus TaxID=2943436 RepID=UPI0024459CE0|nr:high affinity cationic amino acid transporter 1-like [Paramacrobiotus metropolitanus]